ncbi:MULTISPECIES: hypothetical protein [Lacrimispora]|uniref:Uncharacterized protein n=1 Tax=Lacrimispora celerecrescens TaxID=29354 RepID=A0A084JLJ5_9FIRM|nr:hypothetical protein [Lacrimispora celerecrescens]KEZ89829.1 hypothetical protein IO98_14290 [Lacrimispora celerecrescens]
MEKVGKTGSKITKNVDELVRQFRTIPDDLLYDETYMERFVLEKIGLNNESLGELAPELAPYYGTGIYLAEPKAVFKVYDLGIEKRSELLVVS